MEKKEASLGPSHVPGNSRWSPAHAPVPSDLKRPGQGVRRTALLLLTALGAMAAGCSPIVFYIGKRHRGPLPREELAFRRLEREYLRATERNPRDPAAPTALGAIYHVRGQLEKAEKYFRLALKVSPRYYTARSGLALLYLDWGKARQALEEAGAAAKDNPGDAAAFTVLARAELANGREARARAALDKGLEIDPENTDLLLRAAGMDVHKGELGSAEKLCRRAVASDATNPHAASNLAMVLAMSGKSAEAVERATGSVKLADAGAHQWEVLGYARERGGDATGAEAAYRKSLKLLPDGLSARRRLAALLDSEGRKSAALMEYREAATRAPEQRWALERIVALGRELNRPADVLEARLRLARAFPRDVELQAAAADALEGAGRRLEAVDGWKRVLALDGGRLEARRALARLWKAMGKAGSATLQYKAVLQTDPKDVVALEGLAALHVEERRFKDAQVLYETLVKAHPKRAGGRAMLGLVAAELGNLDMAEEELKTALKLDSKMAIAHRELADVLRKLGEPEAAGKHAREAVTLAPYDAQAWKVLARLRKSEGKKKEAAKAYARAVAESSGKDVDLVWAAAAAAEDASDIKGAGKLYEALTRNPRERGSAARQLARLAKASGSSGDELYWLRAALLSSLSKAPWRARVRQRVRKLYTDERAVLAALQRYWADFARDKNDPVALAGLGALEIVRGQYGNAARSYESLLASKPRSREAAAALVLVYEKLGKPRKSLSAALRLVAIDSRSSAARFECARAYRRLGDERREELALRAALKLDSKNAAAHNALGIRLALSDRLAEARGHFRKAAELAPTAAWPVHNLGVLTRRELEDPEMAKRYRDRVSALVKRGALPPPKGMEKDYWNFIPEEDR